MSDMMALGLVLGLGLVGLGYALWTHWTERRWKR
jgi:hypothetical protein